MKRQYLGDSRDAFKWHYLDHLARSLRAPTLQVVWMMTADDNESHGNTHADLFRAGASISTLCGELRSTRNPRLLATLPQRTGGSYRVELVGSSKDFTELHRQCYFESFRLHDGIVFLDPDNGFEPKTSCSEKHVKYEEAVQLVDRMPTSAVLTVFQYFRRRKFTDDFLAIRERLAVQFVTALYWHSVMFVSIARSREVIEGVRVANDEYRARTRGIKVIP